jgi:hypothetical protein
VRNLFLALLLANLLFLAWQRWVAPPEVPANVLRSAGSEPRLVAVAAAVPTDPGRRLPVPPNGQCMRIGPIADGLAADRLRASLTAGGFDALAASEEGQVWVGHWVQLESVPSREEADRIVARLAAGGLPDAYVLQNAAPFSISLGVFRDRERADAVAAAARRLGFRPQTTDRFRSGTQYWLSVVVPAGRQLPEKLGQESGQILRAEQVACPAGGMH